MANIIQASTSSDVVAFKNISKLAINHLLVNTVLVAGFKVRNKIGGPAMLVQGFREFIPNNYYAKINEDAQVAEWCLQSYPKVQLNTDSQTRDEIFKQEGYGGSVPAFLFFKNIITSDAEETGDSLYVICKYRSENRDKYLYQIEALHELEIVNQ